MQYNMLLKQAREEHGWSQKDVAEKIGTDAKTVSRWERKVAYPSPYFRQKLSDLFQKSLRELDLLPPGEKESENDDTSITQPPTSILAEQEKPQDKHVDTIDPLVTTSMLPEQHIQGTTLQQQNWIRMLGRLRHAYRELLEYSLQQIVRIELRLAGMPNAVQNATNRLVRLSPQGSQILPADTSIMNVYETAERELLILGEPGAGKSTLLLHLAQTLVQQAEQDETHPLPVVLRLSSWAAQKPALEDWMSEQLALTYDISPKLSTRWVHNEQILPLLDGLDEMDAAARSACIAAINDYHREHLLVPLVICSRLAEYEDAASQQKLALQHAVLIQPLTLEQVYASLEQIGPSVSTLRETIQTNQALQELITTPLMLSILMLTYSRTLLPTLSHEIATLQKQMWTDYVAHMTEQKGDSEQYPLQQTTSCLHWLARNLQNHYQTVFYLERVQTDWLPDNLRKRAFLLTMYLPLMLLGMLASCIIGLFLQTVFDLTTGIQAAIIGCVLAASFSPSASTSTEAGSTSKIQKRSPPQKIIQQGLIGITIGLAFAGSFGFELGPGYGYTDWARDGLIYGNIMGIICWFLLALLPRVPSMYPTPDRMTYLLSLLATLHTRRMFLGATLLGIGYGLSTGLSYGLIYGPSAGLNFLLTYACVTFLMSLIVEKNRGDISLTERLRWSWGSFFHSLRSLEHCIASTALALGLLIVVGLSYGLSTGLGLPLSTSLGFQLSYGLSAGLSNGPGGGLGIGLSDGLMMGLTVGGGIGLGYWLGLGLFQSIAQEQIDDQDRLRLNQGVRRSALNSTIIGLLSGATLGSLGFMGYWLSYVINEGVSTGLRVGPDQGLGYALNAVWIFAVSGSVFGWAISGGWAVLRHFALRWLLNRRQIFPWHAQGFLTVAMSRILLQRVGGGYSFIHRLLLEYFAD